MIFYIILVTIIYLLLIASFMYGFERVTVFRLKNLQAKTSFSVIIPFRNEAENLLPLLKSIQTLQYPKHLYEIIFVDDDSEDDSVNTIKKFFDSSPSKINFSVIKNIRKTTSPKKDAIDTAIQQAKHEWIITTDADCILPKYWLDSFDEFIQQTDTKCVAAPVSFHVGSNFLTRFQNLDFLSLQGATIGSFGIQTPFLCNGANFGYKKDSFIEVAGFEGNKHIASGDDIFLLEKMVKHYPKQVHFLKCEQAIVSTLSQNSWKSLIDQRVRWAAKTSSYHNTFGKFTGLIVLLMNSAIILSFFSLAMGFLKAKIVFYIVFIKFNIDVLLIYKTATFYNQKDVLRSILLGFLIYPVFCVYIAILSLFKEYKWKGRNYKK